MAYKRDIDDVRESPALDIIHLLQKRGAVISYSDPHVPEIRLEDETLLARGCRGFEHRRLHRHRDRPLGVRLQGAWWIEANLIVDTRNALKGFRSDKIVRL